MKRAFGRSLISRATLPVDTAPLWDALKRDSCERARTTLIEAHLPLVHLTRQRIVPRVPERLDAADLDQEGCIAVVQAVDRFEPARGVKFSSFCISMIRGAIFEYLRKEDWAPRSVRDKQKTLARAADSLVHALGREPEDEETAAHLGLDLEALRALQRQAKGRSVVSLDALINQADPDADFDPLRVGEAVVDPSPGPDEIAMRDNESELLWQAVRWLPETEREVVCAYYDDGLTLKVIAERMDRSESRVHQYHTQAMGRLRTFLGSGERRLYPARGREPAPVEEPAPESDPKETAMIETATNGATPTVAEAPEWDGWMTAEDETLRELWGRREPNEIARKLGRTAATVKERAAALQLGGGSRFGAMPPVDPRSTWWTPEEDAQLQRHWGTLPSAEIAALTGRNRQAVHRRAKALGLEKASVVAVNPRRRWTPQEDEQLRALHGTVSRREVALKLNRSVGSISCRVEALRLNEERGVVPGSHVSPAVKPAVIEKPAAAAEKPPADPVTPRPSLVDAELLAMAEIYRLLAGLEERERARVVRWVADRWEAAP
jgi:RNA polymerase sigma factor FliA